MERVLLPRTDAVNAHGDDTNLLRKTRQTHSNAQLVGADGYNSTNSTRKYANKIDVNYMRYNTHECNVSTWP